MPWASVRHRFCLKLRSRKHALEGTVWIRCFSDWLKATFRVHLMDIKSCLGVRWERIYLTNYCWIAYLRICCQVSFLMGIEYLLLHLLMPFYFRDNHREILFPVSLLEGLRAWSCSPQNIALQCHLWSRTPQGTITFLFSISVVESWKHKLLFGLKYKCMRWFMLNFKGFWKAFAFLAPIDIVLARVCISQISTTGKYRVKCLSVLVFIPAAKEVCQSNLQYFNF